MRSKLTLRHLYRLFVVLAAVTLALTSTSPWGAPLAVALVVVHFAAIKDAMHEIAEAAMRAVDLVMDRHDADQFESLETPQPVLQEKAG